jgi:MYXO-CTERM domain-containing protein
MVTALLLALSVSATPPAASREDIINRAKPAVGYSYWWGGGCWQADGGGNHGSCVGNCPDCTHSGTYGADCSGYVFKAWQIDGASNVSSCNHGPYTASSYHNNETHWTHINRANAKPADILASTTHVVLIQSGDPWGTPQIMEARGCSYGIQRNVRSLGSTYNASVRDNLVAAQPPAYKATYVNQSFPYASQPAIEMKEGETLDGFFDLKNEGTATWNANTKLAPTPRDQPSPLADASWLSPTRIVSPGSVAPGQVGHFAVRIHAGAPGDHWQTFGLVQEGVTWFAQQGGPPDTQLAIKVRVTPRDHAATLVSDAFEKDADGFVVVELGSTVTGSVDIRNDGHVTWDGAVKLAPTPRDQASPIAATSWLSPTRVATADATTPEGQVARFTFEVAGNAVGETTQAFGLVHEAVTWFADAGFGPADGFFTLKVRVVEPPPPPPPDEVDPGEDHGSDSGDGGNIPDDGEGQTGGGGKLGAARAAGPSVEGGCSQTSTGSVATSWALLGALAALLRRRRR